MLGTRGQGGWVATPKHGDETAAEAPQRVQEDTASDRAVGSDGLHANVLPVLAPPGARATHHQRMLIALQRTAGNAAVQRLVGGPTVQRAEPGEFKPSMFQVANGNLKHTGAVTAQITSADPENTWIKSPKVAINAQVTKDPAAPLGHGVTAFTGATQTIHGSKREGVYRLGGVSHMPVVATQNATLPAAKDAWVDPSDPEEKAPWRKADSPFYGRVEVIDDGDPTANVNFEDEPQFWLPRSIGPGILTSIQGQESFTTAISVQRDADLIHLQSHQWAVDWTMDLSPLGSNTGQPVTSGAAGAPPPVLSGATASQQVSRWVGVPTLDAAMGMDASTLLANIADTRKHDPASYKHMVAALRAKNPRLKVWITVDKTAEWLGADEVEVTLTGHSRATRGPTSLNDGDSGEFDFNLNDVANVEDIDDDFAIEITAGDAGWSSNTPNTATWQLPLSEAEGHKMKGGAGEYRVSAEVLG